MKRIRKSRYAYKFDISYFLTHTPISIKFQLHIMKTIGLEIVAKGLKDTLNNLIKVF